MPIPKNITQDCRLYYLDKSAPVARLTTATECADLFNAKVGWDHPPLTAHSIARLLPLVGFRRGKLDAEGRRTFYRDHPAFLSLPEPSVEPPDFDYHPIDGEGIIDPPNLAYGLSARRKIRRILKALDCLPELFTMADAGYLLTERTGKLVTSASAAKLLTRYGKATKAGYRWHGRQVWARVR